MSSQTHQITITARDGTKATFDSIKRGADQDARALQEMGKSGSKAFGDLRKGADDAKVGIAALGVAFGIASRAAQDQTRQIDAITRLYGESADAILKQTEAIQDNTRFSNDQARQAAITGSTLAQNYGITADQIAVLIERSADLAQVHGIDLADAMSRVSGAIRGEGEAAELLGLNMSDSAVAAAAAARGLDGWTTSMTEAEKAAFRYQLVLEQTTATQGAASDAADTTAGRVQHLANEAQDAAQNFAAWTGPIGQATAALSDHALEIAVVGGGLVKLAAGLKEAGVASRALSLAMGPAGIVVAAGAATYGIMKLVDALGTSYPEAADNAQNATERLIDTINDLAQAGSPRATLGETWRKGFEEAIAPLMAIQGQLDEINKDFDDIARQPVSSQADADARNAALDALEAEKARLEALADQYGGTTQIAQEYAETEAALAKILADRGPGAERVLEIAQGFKDAYTEGRISLQQYMDMTQFLADTLGVYDEAAIRAAGSTDRYAGSADKATSSTQAATEALGKWVLTADGWQTILGAAASSTERTADSLGNLAKKASAGDDETKSLTETMTDYRYATAIAQEETSGATFGLGAMAEKASAGDAAMVGLTGTLRDATTATERMSLGVGSAGDALAAFKSIQDGIIAQQDVFNQQFSEYGSQINAIERAQDILNQRREEGIALSEDELAFLEKAPGALERLTGGQEDAAIAAGELAAQYGENMSQGDQLNQTLSAVAGTTGELTNAVTALTTVLLGVAGIEANPSVSVAGLAGALSDSASLLATLYALDGLNVRTSVTNVTNNITNDIHNFGGTLQQLGGMIPQAALGRMVPHGYTLVGEAGPELIGNGTVWPAPATKLHLAQQGGGGGRQITIYGSVNVYANDPQQFWNQMQSYGATGR